MTLAEFIETRKALNLKEADGTCSAAQLDQRDVISNVNK